MKDRTGSENRAAARRKARPALRNIPKAGYAGSGVDGLGGERLIAAKWPWLIPLAAILRPDPVRAAGARAGEAGGRDSRWWKYS